MFNEYYMTHSDSFSIVYISEIQFLKSALISKFSCIMAIFSSLSLSGTVILGDLEGGGPKKGFSGSPTSYSSSRKFRNTHELNKVRVYRAAFALLQVELIKGMNAFLLRKKIPLISSKKLHIHPQKWPRSISPDFRVRKSEL